MTDKKKPEAIDDKDLDNAQGGLLQFEIQMAKRPQGVKLGNFEIQVGTNRPIAAAE